MSNCIKIHFDNKDDLYNWNILLETDGLYNYQWYNIDDASKKVAELAYNKAKKRPNSLFTKYQKILGEPIKVKNPKNWFTIDSLGHTDKSPDIEKPPALNNFSSLNEQTDPNLLYKMLKAHAVEKEFNWFEPPSELKVGENVIPKRLAKLIEEYGINTILKSIALYMEHES